MLRQTIASAATPVRAVITGSPVLAARLWAPANARLDKAAEERAANTKALTEARAAELAKLTDEKAIAKAKAAHAQADKTSRAEKRERIGSTLGGGALVVVVAGPISWSLVGPWIPLATWSGIGLWCIGAMMHAPGPADVVAQEVAVEPAAAAAEQDLDDADEFLQDSPDEAVLWALVRHTASLTRQGTAAHLQAVLDEAQKRGEMTDWRVSDLAEELGSYGVAIVEKKKLTIGAKDYTRQAVLLDALPEAGPAPIPAAVQPVVTSAA